VLSLRTLEKPRQYRHANFQIVIIVRTYDDDRRSRYRDTGDSGQAVLRNFCGGCGSPITTDATVMPELTFIKAGTLDDTSWLDPKMHIYCDSAQVWSSIPADSQRFARAPV
jgi:hypothetical protein